MAGSEEEAGPYRAQGVEELELWNWRVWLIENPKKRATRPARTRLAAMVEASKALGVGIGDVDAEVVRDG